ncbi:MAG: HlyD family efflux transporter periplasmic adaptor subunit [Planctomycetaceae bacterium]|nr:MAG: HlyD family efflux transporter periplasmic adaptor subunit [Planctomycetaceae bacterium]
MSGTGGVSGARGGPQLRMRPELVLTPHGAGASGHWIVEDPVTLKYFRLRDEECFILRGLDRYPNLRALKQAFDQRFYPLRLGLRSLNGFLFQLHELGLVVGDSRGQGNVLAGRDSRHRRERIWGLWSNPLSIRLPGIPARRFVDRLYPAVRWTFSPGMLAVWLALVLAAAALVTLQFASFQSRLPSFEQFFNPPALLGFAVALIATKALHELGHAFVSRHLGGSCREIGVLLLALMPTLYCDTSDAWRIPERWKRILISLAGVLVELVVAAIATFIWWFSEPGQLNSLALRVMFLCSVNALLFNANPLIRSDGYFVLADLVDIPNLWQESRATWRRGLTRLLTGKPAPDAGGGSRSLGLSLALGLYAAAATVYRWLLLGGIIWFIFRVLEPTGLGLVAWLLATPLLVGAVLPPLRRLALTIASPPGRAAILNRRLVILPMLIAGLLAAVFLIPLPHRVAAPFWIELRDARTLYAPVAGTLRAAVSEGARVKQDQPVVTLHDPEIELKLAELAAEVDRRQRHLTNLQRIEATDPDVVALIPAEQQSLADARARWELHRQDQQRLVIRAPIGGTVFSPPPTQRPREDASRLASWQGTPLDRNNPGAFIEVGEAVCTIGDSTKIQATLLIGQADVADLRPGQSVELRVDRAPVRRFRGTITRIAKATADDIPPAMLRRLGLDTSSPGSLGPPVDIYYQAIIALDAPTIPLPPESTGHAKIQVAPQPLGTTLFRYLKRTFVIR